MTSDVQASFNAARGDRSCTPIFDDPRCWDCGRRFGGTVKDAICNDWEPAQLHDETHKAEYRDRWGTVISIPCPRTTLTWFCPQCMERYGREAKP